MSSQLKTEPVLVTGNPQSIRGGGAAERVVLVVVAMVAPATAPAPSQLVVSLHALADRPVRVQTVRQRVFPKPSE